MHSNTTRVTIHNRRCCKNDSYGISILYMSVRKPGMIISILNLIQGCSAIQVSKPDHIIPVLCIQNIRANAYTDNTMKKVLLKMMSKYTKSCLKWHMGHPLSPQSRHFNT